MVPPDMCRGKCDTSDDFICQLCLTNMETLVSNQSPGFVCVLNGIKSDHTKLIKEDTGQVKKMIISQTESNAGIFSEILSNSFPGDKLTTP